MASMQPSFLYQGAVWILISSSTLFLSLRLYRKRIGRGWHRDDLVLFASWIALLGNGVLITIILNLSAAQKKSPIPVDTINNLAILGLFSMTLAVVSQSWSKTSFAVTLLYISDGWMSVFLWFAIVSMNILFGLGALFFWIGCTPVEKAWRPLVMGTCPDPSFNIVFGIVVSAYSGIMDLVFAVIPWKIIMPLNMKPKEKLGCAISMSMGIFAGIAAFIKCSKIPTIAPGSGGDSMQLAIWGVAEPALTIMAASAPALRLLVRKITIPKEYPLDENEGDRVPEPPRDLSEPSSQMATWGSRIATWRSSPRNGQDRRPTFKHASTSGLSK